MSRHFSKSQTKPFGIKRQGSARFNESLSENPNMNYRSNRNLGPYSTTAKTQGMRSMQGSIMMDNPLRPLPKANVPHLRRLINNKLFMDDSEVNSMDDFRRN